MIEGHRISVAAPILNEAAFLPCWLKCVTEFADQVVVTDGGSRDDSVNMLTEFFQDLPDIVLNLKYEPQIGQPYSEDWNEGKVRNELLDRCDGDFIVLLDADEIVDRETIVEAVRRMDAEDAIRAVFPHVPFWNNFETVRANGDDDHAWMGVGLTRMIRRGTTQFNLTAHHCGMPGEPHVELDLSWYHVHYAYGPDRLKKNDNRYFDFGTKPIKKPVMQDYSGPYPVLIDDLRTGH